MNFYHNVAKGTGDNSLFKANYFTTDNITSLIMRDLMLKGVECYSFSEERLIDFMDKCNGTGWAIMAVRAEEIIFKELIYV